MLNFMKRRREAAEAKRREALDQAERDRLAVQAARRRRYNQHLAASQQPRRLIDDDADYIAPVALTSAMLDDYQPTTSAPIETFTGGGGDFGGAGASASWDPPATDSSPSSCGVDSSSSSDSSSWSSSCDSGSSSSYDSGSSSCDSGSSSSGCD